MAKITKQAELLQVPDNPTIPFVQGDGTGPDIWAASVRVFDAAVEKAYGGAKKIEWMEVLAGQTAFDQTGNWLPDETVEAFREYLVGIKGPLTTPVGGGIRSLNVALRQMLDLYVCLRPVRYFEGTPSPVKHPEKVDMVIFRENTEDIYAGIEFAAGTPEAAKMLDFIQREFSKDFAKIRFGTSEKTTDFANAAMPLGSENLPVEVGIGIKPVSKLGTQRLVYAALEYAIENKLPSVTLVHKGNIMKFTEGAFRDWGYEIARDVFGAEVIGDGPLVQDSRRQTRRGPRHQRRHRRHHFAASLDAARRVFGDRHFEPQRRLSQRRAGRPSRWHRHRAPAATSTT